MAIHLRSSNKDSRYYRHRSSLFLSRNLYSVVLIEDGGFSEEDEQTRVKYIVLYSTVRSNGKYNRLVSSAIRRC